jgi:hypothetical protein
MRNHEVRFFAVSIGEFPVLMNFAELVPAGKIGSCRLGTAMTRVTLDFQADLK